METKTVCLFSSFTCMPSCPEMPTPTSATWIMLTSLAPSPEINAEREENSQNSETEHLSLERKQLIFQHVLFAASSPADKQLSCFVPPR